jgi:K(+)-stimulated pyrophosphate-energized sodium pump
MALTIYYGMQNLGFYGVGLAALGMMACLPLRIAVDVYLPLVNAAERMAEMAGLGDIPRNRLHTLSQSQSSTASRTMSIVAGGAVALTLYGAYLKGSGLALAVFQDGVFAGLFLGSMVPYIFSAVLLRAVVVGTGVMADEVKGQIRREEGILYG